MPKTKEDFEDKVEVDEEKFDSRPSEEELEETVQNLKENGFNVEVVETGEKALKQVKNNIEDDSSVMIGHSTTLEEIGFVDYLNEGDHNWENIYGKVFSIDDDEKRAEERRKAQASDYFLGSVNAISRTGELVAADLSGSRIGAYPFAAEKVVIISGTNKIMEDLDSARERLWEYAYKFENERAQEEYGIESAVAKELTYRQETGDRTKIILVKQEFGF